MVEWEGEMLTLPKLGPFKQSPDRAVHHGPQVLCHLLPEGGGVLGAPAVAAHAVIAQLGVGLIAHGLGLGGAVFHQLVV